MRAWGANCAAWAAAEGHVGGTCGSQEQAPARLATKIAMRIALRTPRVSIIAVGITEESGWGLGWGLCLHPGG